MIKILQVYPYLRVRGAAGAIDFYIRAFDAQELNRLTADFSKHPTRFFQIRLGLF